MAYEPLWNSVNHVCADSEEGTIAIWINAENPDSIQDLLNEKKSSVFSGLPGTLLNR